MGILLKVFIAVIITFIFFNTVVHRLLVRIERKEQEKFLKNNFDENEIKLYYKILEFHDTIMKKKVYIIPEISVKISRNNFNTKRYVVPLFFSLIDSNSRFDYYCDKLFKFMKLDDTIGDLHIKASILEIIEKYLGKDTFRKRGDLIFGVDHKSKRHKFYLDSAENQLESIEWSNANKNFYNKKIYRNANNINKIAETLNKLDLPTQFNQIFPNSNWERCLYRNNIQKEDNTIKENIDSYHIYLRNPLTINEYQDELKKMIYNLAGTAGNDMSIVDEWINLNKDNQIYWIAVNFHEEDNLEVNLYVRRNSKIDKSLRIIQKVLFWYLMI